MNAPQDLWVAGIMSYFPNVLLFLAAALAASVFVEEYRESVGATGLISTRPEPRYTFTRPSPLTADPARVLVVRSTVNQEFEDQHTARLPSIFNSSFSSSISISSSSGTLLSKATGNRYPAAHIK